MVNVDSRLRLPSPFQVDRRVVQLTGEAYFEVEPDPDRPFIVQTESASVRVRGTAFNVRGYPDEDEVAVAVAEGGVAVQPQHDGDDPTGVELGAGEVGRMGTADTTVQTRVADVTAYTGWTEGRLVFEDAPLQDVARRLERWYDLEVRIRDPSLRSLQLTASLKSRSVENVLDVITASLGIRYRIDHRSVLLGPRETGP
jgi:ferric-dicitrate binding protein FerR (iron transport regulator)